MIGNGGPPHPEPVAFLAVTVVAECKTPDGVYVLVRLACWPDQPAIMVRADALCVRS